MTQALAIQNLGKGYSATTPVKVPKIWSFWNNKTKVQEASRPGQARGHDVWESSKMDKRGTRAKALGEKGGRDRKAKGIWEGGEGRSSGSQGRVGDGDRTAGFLEQGLLACSLAVSCPGPDVGSCLSAVRGSRAVPLHFPRVCTFANLFWKSLGSGAGQGLGCSWRLESNFNESELEL